MNDYQALLAISSVLVDTRNDEMTQLTAIKQIMYQWSLNLKRLVKLKELISKKEATNVNNKAD